MRLIDADELKEPVGSYNPVKWTSEYGYVIRLEDIDHAPTVELVKHGRWETEVRTNRHGTRSCLYACSLCGILSLDEFWYCPHCGAKMDEVSE